MKDEIKMRTDDSRRSGLTRRQVFLAAAGALTLAAAGPAFAQGSWPEKPVEIICGFAPGGGTDLLARALADALSDEFGVPFQVINRTGGGGVVGFEEIASAAPDGYKLGILTAQVITANLRGVMQKSYRDFTPIAMASIDYAGFAVNANSDIQTFEDLLEKARQNPGALSLGNGSEGGSFHMTARNLEEQAGVKFKHVPFDGGPAAILQLLGGHIDATVNGPTEILPHVQGGQLRMLAVSGPKRLPDLPDVPSTAELGFPLDVSTWRAVGGPAGLPEEVVEKLEGAIEKAVQSERFLETMEKIGSNPEYLDSEGLLAYLQRQEEIYTKILD